MLQVSPKNIQSMQVEGENVQLFKDSKITMDKYVLHSDFLVIDMDVVLGYPWMDLVGIVNINLQKKLMKHW